MKHRFSVIAAAASLLLATAAHAQVNLPNKTDLLNQMGSSIGQGGSNTGSGVGSDLLDRYKSQLNQGMPCTGSNMQGCATPPPESGSASSNPTTPPGSNSNSNSANNNTGNSNTNGSGVGNSGSSGGTTTPTGGSQTPAARPKDKVVTAVNAALKKRIASLGSSASEDEVKATVRYVQAMTKILQTYNSPGGAAKIDELLKQVGSVNTAQLRESVKKMLQNKSELNVLQAVQRQAGVKSLADAIDDSKNGGAKMKAALNSLQSKLRNQYLSAQTDEERDKIRKAVKLLTDHVQDGIPDKVIKATLTPYIVDGDMSLVSGKDIAKLMKDTDDFDIAEEAVDSGDIIRRRAAN